MDWLREPIAVPCETSRQQALERQKQLTKPPGSLGQLEHIAVRLAALQRTVTPRLDAVYITVFAADHGIAEENVSAFPQAVTGQMLNNFAAGGAAICVLARTLGARLEVVDVGVKKTPGSWPSVIDTWLANGTSNFVRAEAMSQEQLSSALLAGYAAAERAKQQSAELFIGGDMGIGNTTAATALACTVLRYSPTLLAGPGTGLDKNGVCHKAEIIELALQRHKLVHADPLIALRCVGGFEIAALTGAYLRCAQQGLVVLVDGFITSVAALLAVKIAPLAGQWFIYAHRSQEPGHRYVLEALAAIPLLDLNMRLGEGSGAAVAVPLLRLACALNNEMATFAEAGVAQA